MTTSMPSTFSRGTTEVLKAFFRGTMALWFPEQLKVGKQQRTFAALAQDTQCLQQMAAMLTQRSATAARESMVGLTEEMQLYAICMEELPAGGAAAWR